MSISPARDQIGSWVRPNWAVAGVYVSVVCGFCGLWQVGVDPISVMVYMCESARRTNIFWCVWVFGIAEKFWCVYPITTGFFSKNWKYICYGVFWTAEELNCAKMTSSEWLESIYARMNEAIVSKTCVPSRLCNIVSGCEVGSMFGLLWLILSGFPVKNQVKWCNNPILFKITR